MTFPATPKFDVVVVGGGIVGLATAHAVARTGRSVAVVEREQRLGTHQTGHNSNVIHSGLYYAPGGLKARLAVAGCAETVAFCREHDLPHEVTGKLVVATEPEELPRMAELARRGAANGVEVHELDQAGMREHEPHVRGIAALYVPSTGICDYRLVAEKLGELVAKEGGEIHLGRSVLRLVRRRDDVVVRTDGSDLLAKQVVVCAGLRCDELAKASGADPGIRIIPFRGEYAGFSDRAAALVKGLIYPVPDPAFPFLGVHATRRDRRARPRRSERGAGAGARGLLVGHDQAEGARAVAGLPRHAAAGPPALAVRAGRGAPLAVAEGDGPADPADAAGRAGRGPLARRRRGARAGRASRTARWSTTSCSSGSPVARVSAGPAPSCTCSTRPRRLPPRPCRSVGRSSSGSPASGSLR